MWHKLHAVLNFYKSTHFTKALVSFLKPDLKYGTNLLGNTNKTNGNWMQSLPKEAHF